MKRRLNLLSINFTKRELSEVVGGFRMKAIILLVVLIIIGVGEFFTHLFLQREMKSHALSKTTLEQYVGTNKDFENKLKYFFYKNGLLKNYLAEDANGYVYFTRVQNLLVETAPNAEIVDFSYKNNGETSFTLNFANYDEASQFIEILETPVFLDVFQYVELDGFDAADKPTASEFSISIVAQFLEEDEI